ncbi:hypothetical protein GIB67_009853 [Kingdonia uniflora]|uniref:Chloroplast envelope membrane protein n=1 Tax=Kingdonia uniflora TaxID=39325 RepID=A0A7J7LMU4_9MAGN|nr:hypothetical protein GIB67_009853 [Kingdonia uniflora]
MSAQKCVHSIMSTSMLFLCQQNHFHLSYNTTCRNTRRRLIVNAKNSSKKNISWWQKLFFSENGNWFGLEESDLEVDILTTEQQGLSEGQKFEAWKTRAEAITELREAQEDMRNQESRKWEDWLVDEEPSSVTQDSPQQDIYNPQNGLIQSVRALVVGKEDDDDDDDDLSYEDRVFQYASSNSAKFLAFLVIVPWSLDFVVHDFVLMPFLDRYVKTVPLAAEFLDVRRRQKLEIMKNIQVERARFRFEAEIGKSPPLSDDEAWLELRHKALELRDEWRLENRKAFANIWSDIVFGVALFVLLYFNQSKVALLKFTGYKIINNVSDVGKAFLIILITDIFLGYHSESGWQTLLEIIVEHYGLEVDQSWITLFICLVPVAMDACVKLWLFKFLPRLSPNVANIFREMTRH